MKHIHKTKQGRYSLSKRIKRKSYNFGTYLTLEEARKYRDYFESKGWENSLDERLDYSTTKGSNRHICIRDGSYFIYKRIGGESVFFGTYYSLEKARKVRDYFENTGWNLNERLHFSDVYYVSENHGRYAIRKTIDGERVNFGQFKDKESAIEEAKLLKKCDWDLDALCEGIDETVDGEIKFLDGVKKGHYTFQTHSKGRNDYFEMSRGKNPIY